MIEKLAEELGVSEKRIIEVLEHELKEKYEREIVLQHDRIIKWKVS